MSECALGLINDFLSWKLFIPLARTSYCTYLIHYNVISGETLTTSKMCQLVTLKICKSAVYYAQKRSSSFYTPLEQFYSVCGNWTFSLLMAIIVCLTVEMPFLNLERITSYRSSKCSLGLTVYPLNLIQYRLKTQVADVGHSDRKAAGKSTKDSQ